MKELQSQQSMKRLAEILGASYHSSLTLYGAREVIDMRTGYVENKNFSGDTLCNIVSINRDHKEKKPVIIRNSSYDL